MSKEKLTGLKLINSSGFPLQLGLEEKIRQGANVHGWSVLSTEHPWKNTNTGSDDFIDMILKDSSGALRMVVECKRVKEHDWFFLSQKGKVPNGVWHILLNC